MRPPVHHKPLLRARSAPSRAPATAIAHNVCNRPNRRDQRRYRSILGPPSESIAFARQDRSLRSVALTIKEGGRYVNRSDHRGTPLVHPLPTLRTTDESARAPLGPPDAIPRSRGLRCIVGGFGAMTNDRSPGAARCRRPFGGPKPTSVRGEAPPWFAGPVTSATWPVALTTGCGDRGGSVVDTPVVLSIAFSATDLSNRSQRRVMFTVLGDLTARCVRRGALFQPSHGYADDPTPGAVDRPGGRPLSGPQTLGASELADRTFSRGAQT
jgi:hypothetical protein